jgi:hypothetical protein
MPRLRRAARERRQRPQLAAGVWEWLQGKPYEQLSIGTKWDLLILPSRREYWKRIREAVANGEIEVSEDKIHCVGDEPPLQEKAAAKQKANARSIVT